MAGLEPAPIDPIDPNKFELFPDLATRPGMEIVNVWSSLSE